MSPIRLCHVSLTHPQSPINRSLPKAFKEILRRAGGDQDLEVQNLCWNQALKPPRTSKTSTSNTKNIRREIIQIIFLDLKGHWNQAQKPPETSTNHKLVKLYGFKPPKPRRTSATNLQIRRTFETHPNYIPRSQSSLESSSKAFRNLNKPQISEALRIQAFKAPKNFHHKPSKTKNAPRTRRTCEEHKEHEGQRISNKLITRD